MLCLSSCKDNQRASLEQRYAEARLLFQQGYEDQPLQKAEQGFKDSTQYLELNWKFRVLAAEANIRMRHYPKALELLEPEPPAGAPAEVPWRRKLNQAWGLCQLRKYVEAEEHLSQAEALIGELHDRKAELAYFRGRCELTKGQWDTAEHYFRAVAEPGATADAFLQNYSLVSLGWCAMQSQRYEESIDWYSRSLPGIHSLQALPVEERALGSLGFLYAEVRDFSNAQKNSEEAEKIASRLHILDDEKRWLLDLGLVQQIQGQSGAAEESFNKALAIARQLGSVDIVARCLHNLVSIKLGRQQPELAVKYHNEAKEVALKEDDLILWKLDDARISSAQGNHLLAEATLRKLLPQVEMQQQSSLPKYRSIWAVQLELARVSAAQGKTSEAEHWFQSSIATVEEAAAKMKGEDFRTAMLDNMPVFDDYVAFLIAQKQTARALQIAQAGRARTLMQGLGIPQQRQGDPNVWLAKIQNFLRQQNAVILSYFASEKECYLWAITPSQIRVSPLAITRPTLDNLVSSYRQEIKDHLEMESSTSAQKLFQILVQPASDLTPKGTHVFIVADSRLYSVNFETLIATQGAAHYWIDDVDVDNASSMDLLIARGRGKASRAKGLLLMGAAVEVDPHFPALPHAAEEMQSVRKHFPAAEVKSFSGADATPHAYVSSSPGNYKYIYFATHGTSNEAKPLDSAIILSPDSPGSFKLLARDIMDKKLRLNADLVTISACEGAGIKVQSLEGLLGLESAFLRAGAHQVVAALWDVNDAVTPKLVDDFYSEISKGKSAAAALSSAKRAMLHSKSKGFQNLPYYWAPLQLYTGS